MPRDLTQSKASLPSDPSAASLGLPVDPPKPPSRMLYATTTLIVNTSLSA